MVLNQLRVAWVQHCAQGSIASNLASIEGLATSLLLNRPDVIVLPEAFSWLQANAALQLDWAEPLGEGAIQTQVSTWAKAWGCYVVAGSIPLIVDGAVYSTLCVFSPQGTCEVIYRKMHLFSVTTPNGYTYRESDVFHSGAVPVIWHSPWGAIGLAICFDLRFSDMFSYYRRQDVRMLLLPAAFTAETGKAHWHTLVRARAIEHQMVILAVNQTGQHDHGLVSYGHSLLVDAWGNLLCDSGSSIGSDSYLLDLSHVEALRARFPMTSRNVLRLA